VAFIIDVFSRLIVCWQISTSLRTNLAIDALEMAIYARNGNDLSNLVHHSDRGVQGEFNRSLQHLQLGGIDGKTVRVGQGVFRTRGVEVPGSAVA
jgi:putative transposase